MTYRLMTRRSLLAATGGVVTVGATGLIAPARAQSFAPTPAMRGRANNYQAGAPV